MILAPEQSSSRPEPVVRTATAAGVATVVMDAPHNRNALSRQMLAELQAALADLSDDPAVRVIVLTGEGPAFCAGADLREQSDGRGPGPVSFTDVLDAILQHRCPVVARVNGPVRAGGIGLMAACDITVGLASATFGFSEVRIGVVPAVIAVPVLMRMDGWVAHEYFLTGEQFDGSRAHEVGLLNRAVPDGTLDETVAVYVDLLRRGGPSALAATKQLTRTVPGRDVAETFDAMLELSLRHFASPEGQEGIGAMRDKRPAAWLSVIG